MRRYGQRLFSGKLGRSGKAEPHIRASGVKMDLARLRFAWEPRMLQAEWTKEPEPTSMVLVTGAFHTTLGLQPAAGRLLNQADAAGN